MLCVLIWNILQGMLLSGGKAWFRRVETVHTIWVIKQDKDKRETYRSICIDITGRILSKYWLWFPLGRKTGVEGPDERERLGFIVFLLLFHLPSCPLSLPHPLSMYCFSTIKNVKNKQKKNLQLLRRKEFLRATSILIANCNCFQM